MANMRNIGIAIVVLGLLGAMLAASADYTGLNMTQPEKSRDEAAFGWVQVAGVIAGASMLVIGAIITLRSVKKPEEMESGDETEKDTGKEEESVCPTCGATVDVDATNCEECGEKFETETPEDAAEEPESEEPSVDEPESEEPETGEPTDEESKSEKPESEGPTKEESETEGGEAEEYECPTCNATLGADDKKCPKCGEEFE